MNVRDLANKEADRIEEDETLTDDEKKRYLYELGEDLREFEEQEERRQR